MHPPGAQAKLGMDEGNLKYLLALQRIPGLGPIRLKALLDYYAGPRQAWEAPAAEWQQIGITRNVIKAWRELKQELDLESYYQQIIAKEIGILTIFDKEYPESLKQIYDPPIVLFYKGDLKVLAQPCFGVVGSRRMTSYGRLVTAQFSLHLARFGLAIVSGLAFGVDTVAHQAAIEANGKTIAVLGGGLNLIFPSANQPLAAKIIQKYGIVLSEFSPDEPSLPGNFPARNRIVAGISRGVLVTEAAEESGSLITAKLALEQGKEVFAIPGPITSATSKGTSLLIKNGATLVSSPEEILETLGINPLRGQNSSTKDQIPLSALEQKIVTCLQQESKHIDELCRELALKSSEIAANLIKLEIKGVITNLGSGVYCSHKK